MDFVQMPILSVDYLQVGTCCSDTHEYHNGKFYISGLSYAGSYRYVTEPTPGMLATLALFREGTYFDATSENKTEWHHKYKWKPRARSFNRWADEEEASPG